MKSKFTKKNTVKSSRSKRSNKSGIETLGEESEDENPHYKIIGKEFVRGMKKNKTYIEKLTFGDFKMIKFKLGNLPKFALDFFKYVTLYDVESHHINKIEA